MYVSYLTEERRVWPLFSVTSWFVLEAWKQGQITEEHPNTAFSEQQYCALKFTHSLWHVHFSVLPFIQSPALCQIPKDSSTWLMLPVLAMIYSSPVSLPHCDRTKQLSLLVTLCKYIFFFLNISIYSIYRISLYSIHILLVGLLKHSGTFTWSCCFFFLHMKDNHRRMLAELLATY